MLVMVVFFIAFRWIHLSTPLIRLFLLVLILLLMPTLNFLPVWFALSLLRFRLPSRLPMMFILFLSSRRRHTRLQGDWSSDVCSSDLIKHIGAVERHARTVFQPPVVQVVGHGPQVAFRAHQYVVYGQPGSLRRLRDLLDELTYRQSAQKRRLHPAVGDQQGRGLVGIPGFERLQIVVHRSLHRPLQMEGAPRGSNPEASPAMGQVRCVAPSAPRRPCLSDQNVLCFH